MSRISLIIVLSLVTIRPLVAQRRMSLNDCQQAALENNLILRSGRIAIERAKNLQGTAFSLEKTAISLSQDPTSGGSPDNAVTFSQTFEFPTLYSARRNQLKAETQLEKNRLEIAVSDLRKEVASAYYSLLYTIARKRIFDKQSVVYARFLQVANAKLKAGETGQLEWMNAQRLNHENEIAQGNAEKDVTIALYNLQRWLNIQEQIVPADDSLTIISFQPSVQFNAQQTPLGQMLQQQRIVSEKSLVVARQGFLPDISLSASTQAVISGFNPYDVDRSRFEKGNFMGFEIGVNIPLFFGAQRARVKVAKNDVELAETRMQEQLQQLNNQYRTAYEQYVKTQTSLNYYRTQAVAQAGEIERISQTAYEKGEIGYMEYIQNLQSALDIRNQYVTAINNYNQAVIILNYIQGDYNK